MELNSGLYKCLDVLANLMHFRQARAEAACVCSGEDDLPDDLARDPDDCEDEWDEDDDE